jgi:hypothetical protein
MGSYSYGKHNPEKIGQHLRYGLNDDIIKLVKDNGNKRTFEIVERVIVSDYDEISNLVWLEIWCYNIFNYFTGKHRYNVFYVTCEPNENWSCSDIFDEE